MLRADDISEAVDAGVITESQARALEAFARTRRQARVFAAGREERFKLLGGFNDFFIALGVFLLGIGFEFLPQTVMRNSGVAGAVLKEPQFNSVAIFAMGVLIYCQAQKSQLPSPQKSLEKQRSQYWGRRA